MSDAKKLEKVNIADAFRHYDKIGRVMPVFHAYRPYHVQEVIVQFDDYLYHKEDELDQVEEKLFEVRQTIE